MIRMKALFRLPAHFFSRFVSLIHAIINVRSRTKTANMRHYHVHEASILIKSDRLLLFGRIAGSKTTSIRLVNKFEPYAA